MPAVSTFAAIAGLLASAEARTTTTTSASRFPGFGNGMANMGTGYFGGGMFNGFPASAVGSLKNLKKHPNIVNGSHYNSTDGSVVQQYFPIADFGWNFSPGGIGPNDGFFKDPFLVNGKDCPGSFNIDSVHKPTFTANFDVAFADCVGEDPLSEFILDLLPIPFETNLQCVTLPDTGRDPKALAAKKLQKPVAGSFCSSTFGGGIELFPLPEFPAVAGAFNAETWMGSMSKDDLVEWFLVNVLRPAGLLDGNNERGGRKLLQVDEVLSIIFPSLDDSAEVYFTYSGLTLDVLEVDIALKGNYLVAFIDLYDESRDPPTDECDMGAIELGGTLCLNLFVGIAGTAGIWEDAVDVTMAASPPPPPPGP